MAVVNIPYTPRPWQQTLHSSLKRFSVVMVHRGGGKTYLALNELFRQATIERDHPVVCAYIAPTQEQAKDITWKLFEHFFGHIPNIVFNVSDLTITLPNGAAIMVRGAYPAKKLRGNHFDFVVLDEVADMPDDIWLETIFPALQQKNGGALFIGTPKGQNLFLDLYNTALSDPNWAAIKYTVEDTGYVNDPAFQENRKKYIGRERAFLQEFYCNTEDYIEGAYFLEQMQYLTQNKYIGNFPYQKGVDVITGWDIGLDGTAIWYAQNIDGRTHIIDFDFFKGLDIKSCLNVVKGKPYIYRCHFLPHDSVKTSASDQRKEFSVKGQIEAAGYRVKVVKKETVQARISAAQQFLTNCCFHEKGTAKLHPTKLYTRLGLPSLHKYSPEDNSRDAKPIHDEHSHPADAFCYLALGLLQGKREQGDSYGGREKRKIQVNSKWKII